MIKGRRAVGIPLMVVVALLSALLLAPSGGTHALWSDDETQPLGSVRSDNIGLRASLVSAETTLPGSSKIEIQNTSTGLTGTMSATPTVTPIGWDNGLADKVAVSYAECSGGADIGTSPVGPGEVQDLCLTTTTGLSQPELEAKYAGATVQVTSTVTQTADQAPSWNSSAKVTSQHHIDFPKPTHPTDELVLEQVCREPLIVGSPTISWAWPTGGSANSDAVAEWEVEMKTASGWHRIASADAEARSVRLPGTVLGLLDNSWVRVIGYAKADPETKVVGTFEVRVTAILSLVGIVLGASCEEAVLVP